MFKLRNSMTIGQLAALANDALKAQLEPLGPPADLLPAIEVKGDPETAVVSLAAADEAGPGCLSFAVSPAFLKKAVSAGASAVIVPPVLFEPGAAGPRASLVFVEPRLAFTVILGLLAPERADSSGEAYFADRSSVELGENVLLGQGAYIGQGVKIGEGSSVAAMAYIEDGVSIGARCRIHPRAVLRRGTRIGDRCQIHSGAVIGGDGFGYIQLPWIEGGRLIHFKNEHRGGVLIEDDVEIGSNSTIDRGLVADTFIGRGSKIDNLVQIGHNCRIGRDCVIVSQVGVGGHTVVGDRVFLLGQAGLGPGVTLGEDLIISAQSGLASGRLPAGRKVWMGTPAKPMDEFHKNMALSYSQLPKLRRFLQLFKKSETFNDLKALFFASAESDSQKVKND